MMIATLSYQNAYNYGAVFQCAALQHSISELGHECDIIDYRNPTVDGQYALKLSVRELRHDLVLLPFISKKKKNFASWMNSYKKTKLFEKSELASLNSSYDYFVVGSDQVWNMQCHSADTSYFLDFVVDNSRKIAYGASFGSYDIPVEFAHLYRKYLPSFKAISVRESRGIDLVKELSGKAASCVLDPVLLVGEQYWLSRMTQDRIVSSPYIFVYQLGHGKLIPDALSILRKQGKKIVFVTGHSGNMIYYHIGDLNMSSCSPEDFLSLLVHADTVVTNSFHATALSILFHKDFYTISKGGESVQYNSRIVEILREYDLLNRCKESINTQDMKSDIDFSTFDNKVFIQRKASLAFLEASFR